MTMQQPPPIPQAPPLVIKARKLVKTYMTGAEPLHALAGVSLDVMEGEFVTIMGASGSGKSTLMHILGALDRPTSGELSIAGADIAMLDQAGLAKLRNKMIGFVFQQFNLLPRISALRQVMLPLSYNSTPPAIAMQRARDRLVQVGLGHRLEHRPSELSNGQQQRVAIARALVNNPRLILADEPTGALDSVTSTEIMSLFSELNRGGMTIVLVTHDEAIARSTRRIVRVKDGMIADNSTATGHPGIRLAS